jgi:putative endopeptidase
MTSPSRPTPTPANWRASSAACRITNTLFLVQTGIMSRRRLASLSFLAAQSLWFLPQLGVAQTQSASRLESALSRTDLDSSVKACVDFFQFANGGWLRKHPIPPSSDVWGIGWQMYASTQAVLDSILKDAARTALTRNDHDSRTLGIHYGSCMDSAAAERSGWQPIAAELTRIESMRTRADVESEIARLQRQYVWVPFNFGSSRDIEDSKVKIADVWQPILPLPERGYYLRTDSTAASLRAKYARHIENLIRLVGRDSVDAFADARHVLSVETALAEASYSPAERRNPSLMHHKMNRAEFGRLMPGFSWTRFLAAMGRPDIDVIDVQNPSLMREVDRLLESLPVNDWRAYLRWVLINSAAPNLSTAFVNEDFRFASAIYGRREIQFRSERCQDLAITDLRDILDRKYLQARLSQRSIALAKEMIGNIVAAFGARLRGLTWMSDSTKWQALEKLAAINYQFFPSSWRDISALDLRPGPFYSNHVASLQSYHDDDMRGIGKPFDLGRWDVPVSGGLYNRGDRVIIPAGALQPPLFDLTGDEALNYGGLGTEIGHEFTHSFDDQGATLDAHNNLRNWWTTTDLANFRERSALMATQFDSYTVLDSLHVNGKLTLSENIADYGGVNIAYDAFENAMRKGGQHVVIDGFTPEQRFFLAYARTESAQMTPERQRVQLNRDEHAPARWRVNGPLSNMPQFAAAFGCKPKDPMVRPDALRPVVW